MAQTPQPKQGWVTALLNALIPGLGFIYLGKIGLFLIALVLFAVLIPTVVGSIAVWLFFIIISFPMTNTWNQSNVGGIEKSKKLTPDKSLKWYGDGYEQVQKPKKKPMEKKHKNDTMQIGLIMIGLIILICVGGSVAILHENCSLYENFWLCLLQFHLGRFIVTVLAFLLAAFLIVMSKRISKKLTGRRKREN